jgi:hypothetical protein
LKESSRPVAYLYCRINGSSEEKASQEADASAEDTKDNTDHSHVGEVHNNGQEPNHLQTTGQEPNAISKEIETTRGTVPEGPPPPAVVLTTELQVAQHDTDLCAGRRQDEQNRQQESHDVIDLV